MKKSRYFIIALWDDENLLVWDMDIKEKRITQSDRDTDQVLSMMLNM